MKFTTYNYKNRMFAPDHWFPDWLDWPKCQPNKYVFCLLKLHISLDWTDPWNHLYFQMFWQTQLCLWFRGYRVRTKSSLKVPNIRTRGPDCALTESSIRFRNMSIRKPFLYLQAEAMPFFKTSRVTITWKIELPTKITPYIGGVGWKGNSSARSRLPPRASILP